MISGTYLSSSSLVNLASIQKKPNFVQVDLTEKDAVFKLLSNEKPDIIFHLAAFPAIGSSFDKPLETIINNVACQVNLLEAVRHEKLKNCRILVVSSADVYGKISAGDLPIDENTPFNPTNAYAVSKITQDYLGLQYFLSYNLHIIRARPFNHVGPAQAAGFVIADWAKTIAQIEKGEIEPVLRVGNLNVKRDFTDVRDMVAAYVLLIEKGKPGEVYNIGSDVSHNISNILDMFLSLSKVKINVQVDAKLLRPEDALDRLCDSSKFRKLTHWKPLIPIAQTLKDTLDYWRNIV